MRCRETVLQMHSIRTIADMRGFKAVGEPQASSIDDITIPFFLDALPICEFARRDPAFLD